MRLNRFFGNFALENKTILVTDAELVHQIKNVLRLRIGDIIILCDGKGKEARAAILNLNRDGILTGIQEFIENKNEPRLHTILYCSILKNESFELVAEKTTEIGIKEIVPIITARTVKTNLHHERQEKILKEAAEQSGRAVIPILHPPMNFKEAIRKAQDNTANVFFDPSGGDFKKPKVSKAERVGIFIGPEGGWDDNELLLAKKNKFQIVTLSPLTFRAETAAIIGTYLLCR